MVRFKAPAARLKRPACTLHHASCMRGSTCAQKAHRCLFRKQLYGSNNPNGTRPPLRRAPGRGSQFALHRPQCQPGSLGWAHWAAR